MTKKTRTLDNSHFLCLPTMCFYFGKKNQRKRKCKKNQNTNNADLILFNNKGQSTITRFPDL